MSSPEHTQCDRLTEVALIGIQSSSDCPGSTTRSTKHTSTTAVEACSSADLSEGHKFPHFKPQNFQSRVPVSSDSCRFKSILSSPQSGKLMFKTPSLSESRPNHSTPFSSSNKHDASTSLQPRTPRSSSKRTPTPSDRYPSFSSLIIRARTPSSGISSDGTLTPGTLTPSTGRDLHDSGTEKNDTSEHKNNNNPPKSCGTVTNTRPNIWKKSGTTDLSSLTSGIGSNVTNIRTGYETVNSCQTYDPGQSNRKFSFNMPPSSNGSTTELRQGDNIPVPSSEYNRCKSVQNTHISSVQNSVQSRNLGSRYLTASTSSTDREQRRSGSHSEKVPSAQAKRPRHGQEVSNEDDSDEEAMEEVETNVSSAVSWHANSSRPSYLIYVSLIMQFYSF